MNKSDANIALRVLDEWEAIATSAMQDIRARRQAMNGTSPMDRDLPYYWALHTVWIIGLLGRLHHKRLGYKGHHKRGQFHDGLHFCEIKQAVDRWYEGNVGSIPDQVVLDRRWTAASRLLREARVQCIEILHPGLWSNENAVEPEDTQPATEQASETPASTTA